MREFSISNRNRTVVNYTVTSHYTIQENETILSITVYSPYFNVSNASLEDLPEDPSEGESYYAGELNINNK